MQAGLVSTPLAMSDIFTGRGLSVRLLVTVMTFPLAISRAELPTGRVNAFETT